MTVRHIPQTGIRRSSHERITLERCKAVAQDTRMILVVCTGNICRSPMAAGLLQQRLAAEGLAGQYQVQSAGTWAVVGRPAAAYAQQVMAGRGIDISAHRARDIDAAMVAEADLILVMTEAHREALLAEFPEARTKTFLLSEMVDQRYDIADPYGSSMMHFEYCAEDLAAIIEAGFPKILALANQAGGSPNKTS